MLTLGLQIHVCKVHSLTHFPFSTGHQAELHMWCSTKESQAPGAGALIMWFRKANQVAFVRQESEGEELEPPALVTSAEAICKRFGDSDIAFITYIYIWFNYYIDIGMPHASLEVCGFGIGTHHVGAIHPDFFWKANLAAGSSWGTENTRPRGRRVFIFFNISPCPCYMFFAAGCAWGRNWTWAWCFWASRGLSNHKCPWVSISTSFHFSRQFLGQSMSHLLRLCLGKNLNLEFLLSQ